MPQDKYKKDYSLLTKRIDVLKKVITVFTILFVMLVLPVSVNSALTPQDTRSHAQSINSSTETSNDTSHNTYNTGKNVTSPTFVDKIYPFVIGVLIIIWGCLIFTYFGIKFTHH